MIYFFTYCLFNAARLPWLRHRHGNAMFTVKCRQNVDENGDIILQSSNQGQSDRFPQLVVRKQ
jgi:hypothetical protein